MSKYRILFLDIDGTIIRPDDTIELSTKQAISNVQEKGIEVVVATGRPIHEIEHLASELNIHSFIGYNGAFALYNGQNIYNEPMNEATVQKLVNTAKLHNHELVLYTSESNYLLPFQSPKIDQFIKTFHLNKNKTFSTFITKKVLGMTIITDDEKGSDLYQIGDGIHLSQVNVANMRHCFDVIRDSVNKGSGVEQLLKHLDIPRECSIAFGDGMNDKEMIEYVGEGFAMGNSHPDLFAYAKHLTTDVNNSGIYNGLKSLGLMD
jgi:Cof subfamily protein (haloacid dehalogenase superfamily)